MLETKRTSITLAIGSAAFKGGRPLLFFPSAGTTIAMAVNLVTWSWPKISTGYHDLLIIRPASSWDFTEESATESGAVAWSNNLPAGTLNSAGVQVPIGTEVVQQFYRAVKLFPKQEPSLALIRRREFK